MVWNRELKKLTVVFLLVFIAGLLVVNFYVGIYGNHLRQDYHDCLSVIVGNLAVNYPEVPEETIIRMLNETDLDETRDIGRMILGKYGVFYKYGSISFVTLENRIFYLFFGINIFLCLLFGVFVLILLSYIKKRQRKIAELKRYMEGLNRYRYKLELEDNADDELSLLRNEIYKLTVLLKEKADLALKQRRGLSDSIADISHQLKTPITSMMVLVNNLSENMEMDVATKQKFLSEIMRQLTSMSWLIATMLKLSKLEAGVVELERRDVDMEMVVREAMEKVEIAAEWKNVRLEAEIQKSAKLLVDQRWTVEALTNIIKNAIEHSTKGTVVEISGEENDVYAQILVRDHGEGISDEERKRLFRRFYVGSIMKEDSVGIGLSLAKEIVEKQEGRISVESRRGEGTVFQIRFLK